MLQLEQVMQPTAALVLYLPTAQFRQTVKPPTLNVPAEQGSTPERSGSGFVPAGADLHALDPSLSEYSPSWSHEVHVSVAPGEAVPGGHSSAAVLPAFVLNPAGTVVQNDTASLEYFPYSQAVHDDPSPYLPA